MDKDTRKAIEARAGCKPSFEHDCDSCIFMGHHNGYDVYFCVNKNHFKVVHDEVLGDIKVYYVQTIVGRYGHEGHEYASGFDYCVLGLPFGHFALKKLIEYKDFFASEDPELLLERIIMRMDIIKKEG